MRLTNYQICLGWDMDHLKRFAKIINQVSINYLIKNDVRQGVDVKSLKGQTS